MVQLHMAQYVTEKSDKLKRKKGRKKPMFRNYIEVMKKLLDANKEVEKLGLWLSLHAWMVMSGGMFPRTPYGAAWSVQTSMEDIHGLGEYAYAEAVWRVVMEAIEDMQRKLEGPISDVQMNGFSLLIQGSVDHGRRYDAFELVVGIKESEVIPVLRRREEEMMVRTVRDFIGIDGFWYYLLDGEVSVGVLSYEEHLERAREELYAEKEKHIDIERKLQFLDDSCEGVRGQCTKPNVVPAAAVEDIWQTTSDATVMSSGKQPDLVLRKSAAVPETTEGGDDAIIDSVVRSVDDGDVAGHTGVGDSAMVAPASSVGQEEVVTLAGIEGLQIKHQWTPPWPLPYSGSNPKGGAEVPPDCERATTPESDDVPCEGDGVGESSNIVTRMKRRPQSQKSAAVHGTPYTDPTRPPGAWKK
ncbi:hypothetical protein Cgig2_023133 [Carnegiea gigantea]|uniref:Uncharacterized protein n=1 Tax=Carnegiea gigantea TaxID=171969 RepID=A0A9Q1JRM2_9CARY|nr:hypothetical protein Cgig2_023133 [Carnegiea gigantea]